MAALPPALALTEEDTKLMLACHCHLGTKNCDSNMARYVFKRRAEDGIHIIDLRKTWEKLVLAARVIVTIENPSDVAVCAIQGAGATPFAQRAILKFASHTKASPIAGRFTPGTFTNYIQSKFQEPRLLIVTDPLKDHQPLTEASYGNIPVIAFTDTDNPLRYVDIAIPCNNKGKYSIALMYWMLCREVLRLRDQIPRNQAWNIPVDVFVHPDSESEEKAALVARPAAAGGAEETFDKTQAVFAAQAQPEWQEEEQRGMWDPEAIAASGGPAPGEWDGGDAGTYLGE